MPGTEMSLKIIGGGNNFLVESKWLRLAWDVYGALMMHWSNDNYLRDNFGEVGIYLRLAPEFWRHSAEWLEMHVL